MNKHLEDLRLSQTQQAEEIRKDLGGEITELKAMMEKLLANNPFSTQHEGSSGLTAADKSQKPDPPDRFTGEQTNRYNIFPLWPDYVSAVSERFSELFDHPLSELVSLKQANDSIDIYLEKFDCAMTRITLALANALSIFLTNMNQHLAFHVRQFKATTIPEAARITKLHEASPTPHPDKDSTANLQHVSEIKFSTKQESIQHYNSDPVQHQRSENVRVYLALLHLREIDNTISPQQPLNPEAIFYHIEASDPQLDENGSLQRILVGVENGYDEVNVEIPAKYKYVFPQQIMLGHENVATYVPEIKLRSNSI
ncbi:hypothetical protein F2Q68_00025605 [Brassica cretica]|uniref:Retrotransposon gag domain-containing protein n=1 Tax=Brassica cretica TaxID=69181 RepID=A0A8S9IJC9_BRACR|nr:hypothetical protein F2Q68_00025605 [Brassica cretica]